VAEAVESALSQTCPPLEVIVADDGSTDNLAGAVERFGDRVQLLRNEHRGPGAARNAALAAASGEFVVILDADDIYDPTRLEALGELAGSRPELDVLTTDAFLEQEGRVIGRFYRDDFPFPHENQRVEILRRCFLFAPAVRRARMNGVGGFDESPSITPAEDWDCWIRVILAGAQVGLVSEPLVHYRLHEGSLTANRARSLRARVTVMEKAAARSDLTPEERMQLGQRLSLRRRDAVVAEAAAALAGREPGGRRHCLRLALGRESPLPLRAKAATCALIPALGPRLLGG
jgi:glycosyltransferase involved in cell wall biosynthesis